MEINEMSDELRTALARYAHDQAWAGWMKYLFSKCVAVTHEGTDKVRCLEIPLELVQRWGRQTNTPFDKLPESERKSDYDEADKILAIVQQMTPRDYADDLAKEGEG